MARYRLINWHLLIERAILIILLAGLCLYMVYPWLTGAPGAPRRTIIVYGFSILSEVMQDAIFPAFETQWAARTGEDVEFISSFAGSGTITNQIILGVPVEVGILSLELDAWRLVDNGVLPGATWQDLPNHGILNRTPLIILARPGNPHHITDFGDLTQPGIGIVHPDPLTSGGALWAILAEYASALRLTGNEDQAYDQLIGIWRNVVAQASSARAARTQYESGFGDALITYEQEVAYDRIRGALEGEVIYPRSTILSEHIVVLVEHNIPPEDQEMVKAFVSFLWSNAAQQIFVDHGFRSVDEALNVDKSYFGEIEDAFTVADLGGWLQAKQDIIDAIWKNGVLPEVGR